VPRGERGLHADVRREAPGDAAALRLRLMCGHVCAMAWKLGAPPDERSLCVVLFLILLNQISDL